jgi:hypothetical protein
MRGRLRYLVCSRHALDGSEGDPRGESHFIFAMLDSRSLSSHELVVLDEFPDIETAHRTAMLWNRLERMRAFETNSWV